MIQKSHFRHWLGRLLAAAALALPVMASANEASIKKDFEARFPGVKVDRVSKAGYLGLYEVVMGQEVVYTDEKATYLINGEIIETKTRRNLTQERIEKLSAVKFDSLPFDLAIKQVRGNGKRQIAMFSDPNCPYCKQMDQAVAKMDDITVYTFLLPILARDSPEKAKLIWCSADRAKAYNDWMLSGKKLTGSGECDAPLARMLDLGRELGIKSVPVTVVASGQRVVGARIDDLQRLLAAASPAK